MNERQLLKLAAHSWQMMRMDLCEHPEFEEHFKQTHAILNHPEHRKILEAWQSRAEMIINMQLGPAFQRTRRIYDYLDAVFSYRDKNLDGLDDER